MKTLPYPISVAWAVIVLACASAGAHPPFDFDPEALDRKALASYIAKGVDVLQPLASMSKDASVKDEYSRLADRAAALEKEEDPNPERLDATLRDLQVVRRSLMRSVNFDDSEDREQDRPWEMLLARWKAPELVTDAELVAESVIPNVPEDSALAYLKGTVESVRDAYAVADAAPVVDAPPEPGACKLPSPRIRFHNAFSSQAIGDTIARVPVSGL
ncbi:MAG: hypothetical protein HY077_16035 [Elusimicrobia bacterium]|nr:hypothetical protein [Elusimicrobiota bacterium]